MTPHLPSLCRRLALPLLLSPLLAHAAPLYSMTIVADHMVRGLGVMNNAGDMAFMFDTYAPNYSTHTVVYQNGTATELAGFGGKVTSAYAINNSGAAVGSSRYADSTGHAFVYKNGIMTDLTPGAVYERSNANGINDAGQIVGHLSTSGPNQGFLYQNGSLSVLPELDIANGINNHGEIIGSRSVNGDSQAVTYKNGAVTDVITVAGGQYQTALAINDSGQVMGSYDTVVGGVHRSFIYENGVGTDLGSLYSPYGNTLAHGLNNFGEVVGGSFEDIGADSAGHGFIYSKGQMTDLNSLIDPVQGWKIVDGASINDHHQILVSLCKADDHWDCRAARLDLTSPVPEPETYAMLLSGLGLLGWSARRKARKTA
ncbi:MAG: PEP-CTERM sorting domain-containing protein [Pseudomonadota bacterium]